MYGISCLCCLPIYALNYSLFMKPFFYLSSYLKILINSVVSGLECIIETMIL